MITPRGDEMEIDEQEVSWLERVEALIGILEGSTIAELELSEAGTEIIIRRQPGMVMVSHSAQLVGQGQTGAPMSAPLVQRQAREERGVAIVSPLTGVYYAAPSPTSPAFVTIGDVVNAGQVIALIEAMKVFNEIQAEVSGNVIELVATNGEVVQRGDVLMRVEPA